MTDPNLTRTWPITVDSISEGGAGFATADTTGAQCIISPRILAAADLHIGSRAVCKLQLNAVARAAVPYAVQYVDPDATAALRAAERAAPDA